MAVEPLLLPSWHLLASVEEEYNAAYLRCASSGDVSLFGKGAGALPTATAVLGDLIDLAQDNSVQWPLPQPTPLAGANASALRPPRRHYLRIVGQPHPGLERRIETLVRHLGLIVQNRAGRHSPDRVYLGFMISAASDDRMTALREAVARLGDEDAMAAPHDARALAQHDLDVARILGVLGGDLEGLRRGRDVRQRDDPTLGLGHHLLAHHQVPAGQRDPGAARGLE